MATSRRCLTELKSCPYRHRARPPQVEPISPGRIEAIHDATDLLVDEQDVPPIGLAYQAIEMSAPEAPLDAALRRVLRQMKV